MTMKRLFFRTALLIGAALALSFAGCGLPGAGEMALPGGRAVNHTVQPTTQNEAKQSGTDTDEYYWFIWAGKVEGTYSGSATITVDTTPGNYQTSWSNITNFTSGKGWQTGTMNRVINYSGSFNGGSNGYLAVYGWMENPLIEYYILETWGDWDPKTWTELTNKNTTVNSDGGNYNIYTSQRSNAPNITGTNANFTQYWSIRSTKKTAPLSGTVTVANHFDGWKRANLPLGTFATRDYQVVETEGYHSSGSSNITISEGDTGGGNVNSLVGSVFTGSSSKANTGDYRGHYTSSTDRTHADMIPMNFDDGLPIDSPLSIKLEFGNIVDGDKIELLLTQILVAHMLNNEGKPSHRYIQVIGFSGLANFSGNTITATPVWYNTDTDTETSNQTYCLQQLTATLENNNTLSFDYDFHRWLGMPSSSFAYSGYGTVTREGAASGASAPSRAVAAASAADLAAILEAVRHKNLSVTAVPKIGYGSVNLTVSKKWSAYSVVSGQYNGVVQLQFTNPSSPARQPIMVTVIDPADNQQVRDFRAADSNPYYWGWGGEIKLPKPNTRYIMVIRKIAPTPVSFTLRAW